LGSTEEEQQQPTEMAPSVSVSDANDLRGFHFKRLISSAWTWGIVVALMIAAGLGAAIGLKNAGYGGAAAVLVLLVAIVVVFVIADRRAAESFFESYAGSRGMTLSGRAALPAATPLLRKGDNRYAERALSGPLGAGVDGVLALYTYEERTTGSEGQTETNYYHYTVGISQVPECVRFLPELYCQRKSGLRSLEKLEDVFRRSKVRIKLESEKVDERYEIFAEKNEDQNWIRQFFSPTFIVWMMDSAPNKFAFELVDGTLCCFVNGHKQKAEELDAMRAATTTVATRLRDEASE
jgi:hypothetical protein